MWIYTTDGAYSVVRKDWGLMVRSRVKGDLEKLFPKKIHHRIILTPDADYLYRILVSRDAFEGAMIKAVRRINYFNFKDTVHEKDKRRAPYYTRVWAIGRQMQDAFRPWTREKEQIKKDRKDLFGYPCKIEPGDEDIQINDLTWRA
jgi:hypothetical protein